MTDHFDRVDDFKGRRRNPLRFNVRPRYSCGSPAQVSEQIARQVAKDELVDYERYLSGVYGEGKQGEAKTKGLSGIVEVIIETRKGWDVLDLLTGERFTRPFN